MTEFYLDASESPVAIEPDDLHKFPLGRLESLVNQDAVQLKAFEGKPAPELSVLASHFATYFADIDREVTVGNWVAASFAAQQLVRGDDRVAFLPDADRSEQQLVTGEQRGRLPVMRVSRAPQRG